MEIVCFVNNETVCSALLIRLSTWRCPHLLVSAVLRTRAVALLLPGARRCQSISFAHTVLSDKPAAAFDWWDRLTDGRTDTGSFYRPCSAYYAQCQKVSPVVKSPMLSLTEFSAKIHVLLLLLVFWRDYWKICWNMWQFVICEFSNVKWKITVCMVMCVVGPQTQYKICSSS